MKGLEKHIDKVIALCKKHRVSTLYAFGSVVRDDYNKDSDIDLVVDFLEIPLLDYADVYFDFLFALEDLYKRNIDLITYKSLKNPYFIKELNLTKKLIYDGKNEKIAV